MDTAFLTERIERTKASILLYEDAVDALTVRGVESYTLDSGQTRTVVTRVNLAMLQNTLTALYTRLDALDARLNGGGMIAGPGW